MNLNEQRIQEILSAAMESVTWYEAGNRSITDASAKTR